MTGQRSLPGAAVTRVSNTFMSANPRFFSEAEDAFRSIEAEKDPAKDPHVVAWSHVYLGRIFDLQGERDSAVAQYKAALAIANLPPDARSAAERGEQQPYEPPAASHQKQDP